MTCSAEGERLELSIVIVNWNTRDLMRSCLELIPSAASGLSYETIVVDNGSRDGSTAVLKSEFPEVSLVENDANLGFARAVNQGISISGGRFIALINTDVVLSANSLSEMVRHLQNNVDVAAAAPQLIGREGYMQYSGGYAPSPHAAFRQLIELHIMEGKHSHGLFVRSNYSTEPLELDWLSATCMVINRESVELVGKLDESHFMYAEDVEYGIRLTRAGWKLHLLPWITVIHYQGASTSAPEMRLMWLGGVFRVAANNLTRASYVTFGLFLSAAYLRRCLTLKTLNTLPIGKSIVPPGIARPSDLWLYSSTSFRLAMSHPGKAAEFCERLEKNYHDTEATAGI